MGSSGVGFQRSGSYCELTNLVRKVLRQEWGLQDSVCRVVWEAFQKVKGRSQGQSVWNNEWKSLVSGKSRASVLNILAQMILCYGGCPGIVGYLAASLVSTYEMPVIPNP